MASPTLPTPDHEMTTLRLLVYSGVAKNALHEAFGWEPDNFQITGRFVYPEQASVLLMNRFGTSPRNDRAVTITLMQLLEVMDVWQAAHADDAEGEQ